jgi:hypothetical protein
MEMETHNQDLNQKLDKLVNKQQHKIKKKQRYTRTINLTKIRFTHKEMALFNKPLQYSIKKTVGQVLDGPNNGNRTSHPNVGTLKCKPHLGS